MSFDGILIVVNILVALVVLTAFGIFIYLLLTYLTLYDEEKSNKSKGKNKSHYAH